MELLKRGAADARRVDWASELIDRQVCSLGRLIDDLMDVSRINRGRIELRREVIALNDVLADALEAIRPLAQDSGHELAVLLPDRKLLVDADRTRLAQAFTNLLNNAVKYTDSGGRIELAVLVEKDQAVVSIRDSGIGIPTERLDDVFEMFSQVESALSRSRGGLGIGLSLTQRLVQMHGGGITAHSEGVGRGSRFMVTLPLSTAAAPTAPQPTAAPQAAGGALRVLVADDNLDAAETLAALLAEMGHEVREVHDGVAAVQAAAAFDPHLLLLDIGMPRMTGYEACARIRRLPGGQRRMLVAVTGWGQPQDLQRSQEAGFDRHLVKPIDPRILGPLMEEVAQRGQPPRVQSA